MARAAALACATLAVEPALADWSLCPAPLELPTRPVFDVPDDDPDVVHASSDDADLREDGLSVLTGNVEVQRGSQQLLADQVTYNAPSEVLEASGNVRFWDEGVFIEGERSRIEFQTDIKEAEEASYIVLDAHAHGDSGRATLTGTSLLVVRDTSYSTCMPGDEDWVLSARELTLDKEKDEGKAKGALLKFKNVPIFYSPILTFPLSDKRKTGFLVPKFRTSNRSGFDFTIPFYINLHPQFDATAAIRGLTKRGVQLAGEFRYLLRNGTGRVAGEVLPNDDERNDDTRSAFKFEHNGSFAPNWRTDIDVGWVSDKQYFEDLGTNLAVASTTFIEQRADLSYGKGPLSALARVQRFQSVDDTLEDEELPYRRLPQFTASWTPGERNRRANVRGTGEVVYFDRRVGPTGPRFDIRPTLSYPMRAAGWYVIPRGTVRFTQYDLSREVSGESDKSPSRLVPTLSVDSGMVFDRDYDIGGNTWRQTLEPRAFYLLTPNVGQDDIPIFDTAELTFNFASLFRENRFSGADRVGDANQLTLAMSSRLLAPGDGTEVARVSVGQLLYFRDRKVQLPDVDTQTSNTAPFVAEAQFNLGSRWRALAGLQWDWDRSQSDRHTISLRYKPDSQRVVNLAYRFVRRLTSENIDQLDSSLAWPLNHEWRMVGRFNYSFRRDRVLETFGGLEYESCCWAFRGVVRRYLSSSDGSYDNGVFAQLELKGLTGVGRRAVDFLERSIPGYENNF